MIVFTQLLVLFLICIYIAITPYSLYKFLKYGNYKVVTKVLTSILFAISFLITILTLSFLIIVNTSDIDLFKINLYDWIMGISIVNLFTIISALLIQVHFLLWNSSFNLYEINLKPKWNIVIDYLEDAIKYILFIVLLLIYIAMYVQPITKYGNADDFFSSDLFYNLVKLLIIPIILSAIFILKNIIWDLTILNIKHKQTLAMNFKAILNLIVWILFLISFVLYYIGLNSLKNETWIGVQFYNWIFKDYTNSISYIIIMLWTCCFGVLVYQIINYFWTKKHIKSLNEGKVVMSPEEVIDLKMTEI